MSKTFFRHIYVCLLTLAVCLSACTPHAVREAQTVVAEADSLWQNGRMYGIDEGDSATLAEAYETLKGHSAFSIHLSDFSSRLSDTYAHACYHYGRLLRKKDNPVEAMQAFISATHTRTRDYHILGRVYSNMGSICHLASEYDLSYDMYEQSSEMFLKNGDTINYYYALNDMAFELAEQGKKEEAIQITNKILLAFADETMQSLVTQTRAALYSNSHMYDSVLLVTEHALLYGNYPATVYVLKANALWNKNYIDSALMYANFVMHMPSASKQDQYNMLYILINGDTTLSNDELIKLSSNRSDIGFEILNPLHHKVTIAVELLKQDIKGYPFRKYILLFIVLILILSIMMWQYAVVIKRRRLQGVELLEKVQLERATYRQSRLQDVENICLTIRNNPCWQKELEWADFNNMCNVIDRQFNLLAHKIKQKKLLNEKEIRLCILVLIGGFSDKQMANILFYGEKSIRGIKRNAAKKLSTTSAKMREFLLELTLESSS